MAVSSDDVGAILPLLAHRSLSLADGSVNSACQSPDARFPLAGDKSLLPNRKPESVRLPTYVKIFIFNATRVAYFPSKFFIFGGGTYLALAASVLVW